MPVMDVQQKIDRIREIFIEKDELDRELEELVGGGPEESKPKKKYKKRTPKMEDIEEDSDEGVSPALQGQVPKKKKKFKFKPCCGSNGPRHKGGCIGEDLSSPAKEEVTEETVEGGDEKPKRVYCEDCGESFMHTDPENAQCPACDSKSVAASLVQD